MRGQPAETLLLNGFFPPLRYKQEAALYLPELALRGEPVQKLSHHHARTLMGSGEAKKFRAQYGSAGRHGGSFWTEEADNVGMKLLKGMGWEDGQGLGKSGQGNTSLVKQFRKNDNAGIGGNGGTRDDAFRASQDLFSSVLARLNGGGDEASSSDATSGTTLGSAAESISGHLAKGQLSRRFCRSATGGVGIGMKDTANYGKAAMDEIFGRRSGERRRPQLPSSLHCVPQRRRARAQTRRTRLPRTTPRNSPPWCLRSRRRALSA